MVAPRVLVLRAPGANCDLETAFAFERAGGVPERLHINQVLEEPRCLRHYQILCIPGGFSFGDDLGAGRILGNLLESRLAGPLRDFKQAEKLVLGICNGFQVLVRTGLLWDDDRSETPPATLAWNESGRFEARWVRLRTCGSPAVFFAGIDELELPVAHAEGRFVARDVDTLEHLRRRGQIVLRYQAASGAGAAEYPANPNGSADDVAGLCDPSGRICGLMPHPERHVEHVQHPRWTRLPSRTEGDGLAVFRNAVRYYG